MYKELLLKVMDGQNLNSRESAGMINDILSGKLTDAQIAAFITAMAIKGETYEELAGAATAMRSKAAKLQTLSSTVVDTCGTGGDGLNTFNISTAAAFVVAGAGITVAKHGNRSVSSKCGSADVLEKLGVNLEVDPETVEMAVNEIGIGFMFAPKFHGAMKYAAPARREVGIRSIFNMLGPLTNPAAASCQLLGVYKPQLTEMFAQALNQLGCKRAFVVHGHDGLDEITICDNTRVSELNNGHIKTYDIYPEKYFSQYSEPDTLVGGDADINAGIIEDIFSGKKGPQRNIVAINAAAAIVAGGKAKNLDEGLKTACDVLDQGKASAKLNELVEFVK
ncbi:MAG: anthranilate phosphoribosyltransferase [Sedimentisphaeraceae bacterium JB056]